MANDRPEHRLSHWIDELLERIILRDGPYHWTAVDTGTILVKTGTEEEKRRARAAWENHRKYIGIKPHHLDTYLYQAPLYAQIELKIATSSDAAWKAITQGQRDTIVVLERQKCGHGFAWSIRSYYDVIKRLGFRLHPNAANIVVEIEARYAAAQREAEIKHNAPAKAYKAPRKSSGGKPSAARLKATEALRKRVAF